MAIHTTRGSPNWSQQQTRKAIARLQVGSGLGIVSSGFPDIDRMTGGFWAGDLIVIGGSACIGKTALALNIAEHIALRQSLPVTVFSMDMTSEQIAVRILCSMGRISLDNMRSGNLTEHERPRLAVAIDRLAGAPFVIEHATGVELDQLLDKVTEISKKWGRQSLIVVDYLQLIFDTSHRTSQSREIGVVLRELKNLATELKCPIIAISELPSEVEIRSSKRSMMRDLGSTDLIGTYADVVMLLYRDDIYSTEDFREPGVVDVIFPNRPDGSTGLTKLVFLEAIAKYEVLASGY